MTSTAQETIARLKEQAEAETDEEDGVVEEEVSKEKTGPREYVVLFMGAGKNWSEVTRAQATSTEGAIRSLGDSLKNDMTYVAVPARNWKPVTVAIETKTALTLK